MPDHNSTHLCIATGQNAANFIPLKQLGARRVLILETPAMKAEHSAANLKLALARYVPEIQIFPFDDANPTAINHNAFEVANKLDGQNVIFHVTGGTKLIVLALHEQLRLLESGSGTLNLVYTDTDHQVLNWLGAAPRQEPMADLLTLNDLLLVKGYRTINDTRPAKDLERAAIREAISNHMGRHAKQLGSFFSTLAYKAGESLDRKQLDQHLDYAPGGAAAELLELATHHGMIHWEKGQSLLDFADAESARFFAGGWTEELVFLKMTHLFGDEQYAMNVKVRQTESKAENEIDAIAVKNNRALIVECKAGRQNKAQDAIYKLSQVVRQVGGVKATGLYVSAQKVSDVDRRRAQEYRLEVIAAEALQNLSNYLRQWATPA